MRPACVRCLPSPGTTARYTAAMNGRDQLDTLWPISSRPKDNVERPSEALYRVTPNANFGWPDCFHDFVQNKLLLNPDTVATARPSADVRSSRRRSPASRRTGRLLI